MHAVYYIRPGENEELRYSLRSVAAHTTIEHVTVVGGYPEWLNLDEVDVLPGNPHENKQLNGFTNIRIAARENPGDFVVFNDDFIVLSGMEEPVPYYHKQSLENHVIQADTRTPEGRHRKKMLVDMAVYLKSSKVANPYSFETHVPMRINGEKLLSRMDDYFKWWGTDPEPLMWRSLYANQEPIHEQVGRRDVIAHGTSTLEGLQDFASTSDRTVAPILPMLAERFPEPSRWEK